MSVRINAARHHQQAMGIHDFTAGGRVDFRCDGGDTPIVVTQDIGPERAFGCDNRAAFYMKHDRLPSDLVLRVRKRVVIPYRNRIVILT